MALDRSSGPVRFTGFVPTFSLMSLALLAGCGGGDSPSEPGPAAVASVSIQPGTLSLVPGEAGQLTATVRDAQGASLSGRTVTWSATPQGIVSVSSSGQVTGSTPGTAEVTATSEGQSGSATITVGEGGFVGAQGGTVTGLDGRLSLVIPSAAFAAGTAVSVAASASPPDHPDLVPGTGVILGPSGVSLSQPASLSISWEASALPGAVDPSTLAVHRWSGTAWVLLAGGTVDEGGRTATGQTSSLGTFALLAVVPRPVPQITALDPAGAVAESPALILTVTGSGFAPDAEVRWNGSERTTSFVSATELQAQIPGTDLEMAGSAQVTVFNPAPGGGTSNGLAFLVTAGGLPPPASLLASGARHFCAVLAGDQLHCWGDNEEGQLGIARGPARALAPIPVSGGLQWSTLQTGTEFSCGTTTGGEAYCWGRGLAGRLGNGSNGDREAPTPVSGGHTFTGVWTGGNHACGLKADGEAWCWGSGADGRLGDGSGTISLIPVQVAGGHAFTSLAVGGNHTCGLTGDGSLFCWGRSWNGQIGDGTSGFEEGSLTPVAVAGGHTFASVSAGTNHTCAVTTGGAAWCWGSGGGGRLGRGSTADSTIPAEVSGGLEFASISAGINHTCALTTEGAAWCWGSSPKLGNGTSAGSQLPVQVVGGLTFEALGAGGDHTCGLTTGGEVHCWGLGPAGQLGTGEEDFATGPVPVLGGSGFASITAGSDHTCAISGTGVAQCWGNARYGQLGDGSTGNRSIPTPTTGGMAFPFVAAGDSHSCALTGSGEAWCWGLAHRGRLGDGGDPSETRNVLEPEPVVGGHQFSSIAAGWRFTCGITTEGAALCWGENSSLQLGSITFGADRSEPTAVSGGFVFASVVAGRQHACALTAAGEAYCWGAGGQVGRGTFQTSATPAPVQGGHTFTRISAVDNHTCGLKANGEIWCWGSNFNGQMGTGDNENALSPTLVSGTVQFTAVSAGYNHSCGLDDGGSPWCWGSTGAGTTVLPAPVSGGISFASITAGSAATCGITADGAMYCWGTGSHGKLGNGATDNVSVPTPVVAPQPVQVPVMPY